MKIIEGPQIANLMRGLSILGEGYGLGRADGTRSDLEVVVKWTVDREKISNEEFVAFLKVNSDF